MHKFFVSVLCFLARRLISLRYHVKVKGKKLLKKEKWSKKGGLLFLPNHPAHVDPILVGVYLWPHYHPHPLVVEYMYRQKWIRRILKLLGSLVIPDFATSMNEIKMQKAKEVIDSIVQGLKKKENFIIYPAGRTKSTGKEILGGASAAHTILSASPEAHVVLIRTTGLWGSSFSRIAHKGRSPNFSAMFLQGVKYIFKNFIFFMPRRKVLIEIQPEPKDFPKSGNRLEINRYLEAWYNQYKTNGDTLDAEPISQVSYLFWKKELLDIDTSPKKTLSFNKRTFSSKTEEDVITELSKKFPDIEITADMDLAADLGIDSLDIAEMVTFLDVHYSVENVQPEDLITVQDIIAYAEKTKKPKQKEAKEKPTHKWPEETKRVIPELPTGITISEAFLRICDRMGSSPACGDDVLGVLSYNKLKIAAILFSKEIKKIKGKHIGILLPASSAAYILILASLLAGKIPVMLNWTLGPRYLNYMVELTDVKKVLTSWKFLERLNQVEFGDLTKNILILEDIKEKISKWKKLNALRLSWKKAIPLLRKLKIHKQSEDEAAVILFTSGTEAKPKGVPLSHKNILADQRAAMQTIELKYSDVLLGCLPPFHSFGFSVAGLFPILGGIKITFSPDPTACYTLAEQIQRWKISILCVAPSFLKGILAAAKHNELKSVRLFVTGAEKTPKELFDAIEKLNTGAKLIEGYGITECAPIISISRANLPRTGVGQLLPGIEACTVDPETKKRLSKGKEGELCFKGENVFSGYLGKQKSPFVEIDGEKWYASGDIGWIDERNNVVLSGRLKRFTKIGGEMVSLGGVEEIISDAIKEKPKEGPAIVVCAKEEEGKKTSLVLFTLLDLEKKQVNQMLKDAGLSTLIRISDIKKVEEIPLTGTGKTDYRYLQTLLE